MLFLLAATLLSAQPPVIKIDRDNVLITQSCVIEVAASPIIDADGNGVIQIIQEGITVDFNHQRLQGAHVDQPPDSFRGIGIKVMARNVTLRNASVSGYKVGISATSADGLLIEHCDASDNFQQRLRSTPAAEVVSDWLRPHANDKGEWLANYGAGIGVKNSRGVTLRHNRVRRTQNGIVLDRVNRSHVYDNDCSFLSGWGLALWRSSENAITRNAFDFCIRGYSHGVYNRGQDSAGILMFEQCNNNLVAENSATHGGDGLFGFAGTEALGETNGRDDLNWYERRGCNYNKFIANDFSYAAAHGLELTFSFGNQIMRNRFVENAICGIWGGYSQNTVIAENDFVRNGERGYGLERGGINIEHGVQNSIVANRFSANACGIHLWWDHDAHIFKLPWHRANHAADTVALLSLNTFDRDQIAIQLRDLKHGVVLIGNRFTEVPTPISKIGDAAVTDLTSDEGPSVEEMDAQFGPGGADFKGNTRPIGARRYLAGRQHIIMTEWGPWDHESPLLRFERTVDRADEYRLFKAEMPVAGAVRIQGDANIGIVPDENLIVVHPPRDNTLQPYIITFEAGPRGQTLSASGVVTGGTWEVRTFKSAVDPREDVERWRREGMADHQLLTAARLDFRFGNRGMAEARGLPLQLPHDHFGVIATRTLTFPAGRWRISTLSDDGIRVWMSDQLVIDDWTHHGPIRHDHEFTVDELTTYQLRVEYFELAGHAVLALEFERVD